MADYTREPWMDPAVNAAHEVMEGTNVKPVMIIGPDGLPKDPELGGGGSSGPVVVDLNHSSQLDSSGRLRVSEVQTQIDVRQINDNQSLLLDRSNIGTATQVYSKNLGGTTMSVSANNDVAVSQTKQFASYFSGKSQLIQITFNGIQNQANVLKRAGYFSSNTVAPFDSNKDGIWFESDGVDYRFRIQKNGVDILNVAQPDWNIDTASWFNPNVFNVFVVDFLYLGGTSVRFGFVNEGAIVWLHKYNHAGLVASTFVESPNQPVRYEIRSTGGAGSFDQICMHVSSEGSVGNSSITTSFFKNDLQANTFNSSYVALAWRLKPGYRNISTSVASVSALAETNDDFRITFSINSTVTAGDPLVFNPQDDSALEIALGNGTQTTFPASFGKIIGAGFARGDRAVQIGVNPKVGIGSSIDGVSDILYMHITPLTNGLDVFTSVTINEFQ